MRHWRPKDIKLLKELFPGATLQEMASLLNRTEGAINAKLYEIGLKVSNYKKWTEVEIVELKALYPRTTNPWLAEKFHVTESIILNTAKKHGLRKDPDFKNTGCFKKGIVPKNKGLRQSQYMSREAINRTKKTRFKKGQLPPNTINENGVITMRIDKHGRLTKYIKLSPGEWLELKTHNWLKAGNKIPKGYCLWFRDGDSLNTEVENLELITRAENLKRNQAKHSNIAAMKERKKLGKASYLKKKRDEFKRNKILALRNRKSLVKQDETTKKNLKRERKIEAKLGLILEREKQWAKRELAHKVYVSPDTNALQAVRIDAKTIVYVKPGADIDALRKKHADAKTKSLEETKIKKYKKEEVE